MMRRTLLAVLTTICVTTWCAGSFAADAKKPADAAKPKADAPKVATKKSAPDSGKPQLVTEGEFAHWLVQVLGLSRLIPASASDQECFSVLLQNGIRPSTGWNATNVVTRGTLARVTVQAMGRVSEVKNPDKDESYIEFLRSINIDIGTIGEAVEHLQPLDQPLGAEAIVVTTDPLAKVHKIRPVDEQQLGTDMQTITRVFSRADIPVQPPPMTPQ